IKQGKTDINKKEKTIETCWNKMISL
ncbi:MAG: hypothetical protein RL394_467, partial [Bacteroidota bacterium]